MKKILMGLFACMLVLGIVVPSNAVMFAGSPLEGNSWGQYFITTDKPNLVNLWSSQPFEMAVLDEGWTYSQSEDGYQAQWFTTEDYGVMNILLAQQWWEGDKETPLYLDFQEAWYDWDTGTVVGDYNNYALEWTGNEGPQIDKYRWIALDESKFGKETGAHNPGPEPNTATPEPATMLLLGAGLIGMAAFGRKKFFRKS